MSGQEATGRTGVLERIDGAIMNARRTAAVAAIGFGLSVSLAALLESPDASAAKGKTPHARLKKGHGPKQVQEYLNVSASDTVGDRLGTQRHTFEFIERCKSNGRPVVRKVVYKKPDQPMGECDTGKPVTVTEKQPLKGEWIHHSGVTETLKRATPRNNHRFKFVEQARGDSNTAPVQPAQPGPAPSSGTETTPGPTPTPPPDSGNPYASGNIGVDISWPQCGTANETPTGFDFGVVGVNNGQAYSTNPCLASEASAFPGKQLNLYVNGGWYSQSSHINPNSPEVCDTGDENCLAGNYGYNAGQYAIDAAIGDDIDVHTRWLMQVDNDNTWSSDTTQNRNSIQGERNALIDNGATDVVIYSTTAQYDQITGSWINNYPSWGATTRDNPTDARTYCAGHEFTGGPSVLMQYLPGGIDHDVAC